MAHDSASEEWRRAVVRARDPERESSAPERWEPEVWVREDAPAKPPPRAQRGQTRARLPGRVVEELRVTTPDRRRGSMEQKLADAARAHEAGRYADALRLLKPLVESAPRAGSIRELNGLTLYRLGRWRAALKELRVAHELTGSYDQYPVLADCERALGHHQAVARLWEELRRASPRAEVLTEGRIVLAGSVADQGRVGDAIALLEPLRVDRARPKDHHLRAWYVLADLYERAGEVPKARQLFRRILQHDADFHDAIERVASL